MAQGEVTRIRAHRDNIHRYQRLLETTLTDLERQYIESRLSAEKLALRSMSDVNQAPIAQAPIAAGQGKGA